MRSMKCCLTTKFLQIYLNEKGEVDMCTAIEEMMEEREELGENRVNQLISVLLQQSDQAEVYEKIKRAVTDREYQKQLFDQFNL